MMVKFTPLQRASAMPLRGSAAYPEKGLSKTKIKV